MMQYQRSTQDTWLLPVLRHWPGGRFFGGFEIRYGTAQAISGSHRSNTGSGLANSEQQSNPKGHPLTTRQ